MKSMLMVLCALVGIAVLPLQAEEAPTNNSPVRFLVQANKESPLSSVVAGRIAKVNVQLGDSVAAGKVLATLDCADLTARRNAAQAEYHGAQLRYEAKAKLQGLNSAAQLEVGLAAAEVNRTKGQMGIFNAQLAQCRFVAPFDGRVARVYVKEGQGVSAGGGVIDLVGSGTPKARLNVPSGWIVWLKPGVKLDATIGETGKHFLLTVTNISARVDAVSQTVEIEAAFPDKAEGVLPGMSGKAVPQCAADDTTCPTAGAAS
ncbi:MULTISPECIES: efflux RND transporter periplasmic adaptor subunit [unclassified Leclercia]|nr:MULTISPECIES: efflux RND transporter periplasmic adaptor subunit [unclassified Leclercia]MCM5697334.1 efflux RND transporter periplasmic adaptor subunit [Leclercia sp. LTM01]